MARIKIEDSEYAIAQISSKLFKAGYVNIKIPSKALKIGVHIAVRIPKMELVDENKTGKIGSYQIKRLPDGKLKEIPLLKTMFSKYTTIDLMVEES